MRGLYAGKFLAYGVWGLIGLVALGWELSGWKALNRGGRSHVTLSELVWRLERKAPIAKYGILALMLDLSLHFFRGTRLWRPWKKR